MFRRGSKNKSKGRFVTLMLIPEKAHRVHKIVVPFFALKLGAVLASLAAMFLLVVSLDYVHVLGRMAENKALKGENFKLRQDMQLIRNKVESMESTIERVRNYAKKLQMLTGQGDKASSGQMPWGGPEEEGIDRTPASPKGSEKRSDLRMPLPENTDADEDAVLPSSHSQYSGDLAATVEKLQKVTAITEGTISRLQVSLLNQSAVRRATPSLIPIAGWISSIFGYRRNPYDGSYKLHAGVDIAAEPGTPVRAPADGIVIYSGYREGYGKAVVLDHGYGIRTLFAHNSKLFANSGSRVKRGETISQVGSTGHSTGPHLHYEVRKNGIPVNPATFFSRSRF